jgi:hypothetical protein
LRSIWPPASAAESAPPLPDLVDDEAPQEAAADRLSA